jgi:hypothetical protein
VSAALLLPCFWTSTFQAGDLGSHLYNAWLAHLVRAGQAPGLRLVPVWTNVALDWLLEALVAGLGPIWAGRLCAVLVVTTLASGLLFWWKRTVGRWPEALAPILLILPYGWVFRAGFLNFLLGAALGFWALGWLASESRGRRWWAVPFVLAGVLSHALGLAMVLAAGGFILIAKGCQARTRLLLALGCLSGLVLARWGIVTRFTTTDPPSRLFATGILEFRPGGLLGLWCAAGVAGFLLVLVARALILERSRAWTDPFFLAWIVCLGAGLLIPHSIVVPPAPRPLHYITPRIAWVTVVMLLAALERLRPPRSALPISALLAATYFTGFYIEQRWLSGMQEGIRQAVAAVPPGARVVSQAHESGGTLDGLLHMVDQACIGHCFSYANYEPSSTHFRLRRDPDCALALPSKRVFEVEQGGFVAREQDLPLWRVEHVRGFEFRAVPMQAGERLARQSLSP